ncbi:P-type conjugative transfer ATPase TrbB [Rhodomicrobium vannielii ATCC 17100]|uniref:P-type conjugative transfer ATPase TrbB n=1 Tax=Rhodomicrobium vannielii (strain ATCC 17100 / DSM 162 / LMG 4299 / NCIMB 10020 / ATH 3.1.1) TaxID=648757 RepID=E3I8N5_RHOVT|nr:P-type conjugative transfer ATPase TrbB [Rhodomicrobium vannielii]ADP72014.1 P-type conjugative transfer ATPase TrbB [Rhodomicrobium vannielii ATCC 17100]
MAPYRSASEHAVRVGQKLERELGEQILGCLRDAEVIEIMLNPDGVLWVERTGHPMARLGEIPPHQAEAAMATIAALHKTTITRENPILECELPLDGSRFEGLIPPVVAAPSFCIRKRATRIFTLDDYVRAGTMSQRQRALIRAAALGHQNILIVGGTGSGKTTLVNAVIHLIGAELPGERLLILEDTPEIQCAAPNHVFKRTTETIDLRRLLRSTMRYRPDRILVGEVRGGECLDLLKAWNTGHPGGVATVHANNAKGGLIRLENLVGEVTAAPMQKTIAAAVDLIIVIAKTAATKSGRQVQELLRVIDHDGSDYVTEAEE